jgi:hypothetical protein
VPNLSQLIDRIFHNTGGTYTEKFHMTDLINDALSMLVDGAKLKGVQTIAVLSGIDAYALPTDFKSPSILQDQADPNGVIPYNLVDISENSFGYAIADGDIILKPKPTQATTLTHYYYKYATPVVLGTDTPEIDSPYHFLLATYASAVILMLPSMQVDKGLGDRMFGQWEEGKRSFLTDMARKTKASRVREKVIW